MMNMEGFDYDVDRAKSLNGRGRLSGWRYQHNPNLMHPVLQYEQIATIVQANLADIGIDVTLGRWRLQP